MPATQTPPRRGCLGGVRIGCPARTAPPPAIPIQMPNKTRPVVLAALCTLAAASLSPMVYAVQDAPTPPTTQPADAAALPPMPEQKPVASTVAVPPIDYQTETLDNGLRVIYAPMKNAPVVHVRVLYHVGSRDETPDRQGFAHMFEHMMFRGSEHVPSEKHMELINGVGGSSNAFTSFDQTTYVNTVPNNALQTTLWLEADRMAGFKVDEVKFKTERNVVNEEYLQRVVAPPYGRLFMDFFGLAYSKSHYQWTPIGDMDQLRQAGPEELQQFFNTYYVPNNAVLTIAGEFDVDQTKKWVHEYFGWIPEAPEIDRRSPTEPEQREPRRKVIYAENVPLARVIMGYKTTTYADPDQEVLEVLSTILGGGRSSRLYQALVAGPDALANQAGAGNQRLEDTGLFFVSVGVLPGKDADEAQKRAVAAIDKIAANGVTADELAKAKTQLRLQLLDARQTATTVATELGEAEAFGGDAKLVNEAVQRLDAITADDVKAVAAKYLKDDEITVLQYRPGSNPGALPEMPDVKTPKAATTVPSPERNVPRNEAEDMAKPATKPSARAEVEDEETFLIAADAPATQEAAVPANAPRVEYPSDFPTTAPTPAKVVDAEFDMGGAFDVGPMKVVLIRDERLPLVGMTLLLPGGGDAVPAGKEGLSSLTAELLNRGAAGQSAAEWSEALESRGITLSVGDGGDNTRITGSFPSDMLAAAAGYADDLLRNPNLDEGEFKNLKFRTLAGLRQSLSDPASVAGRQMNQTLFGTSPDGRAADLASVGNVSLDDVRAWYKKVYNPPGATLILAGYVSREQAEQFAKRLTQNLIPNDNVPQADYALPAYSPKIVIVDNKGGGQSAVRIGDPAFLTGSDEKYAGSVATEILSSGIESRLNRYLRAQKGLTYGASGRFAAGRHSGSFQVGFNTKPSTTGEAVTSAFEVLQKMASEPITDAELAEAKRRVTGGLVMSTQTVDQQAALRSSITLNDYPMDYYSQYADKIAAVTKEDVQKVMSQYADPAKLTVVVVGPAETVKPQLENMGKEIEVLPMPLQRTAAPATTAPTVK